tara:strand:+ start:155 stop:1291 length:1137 start_codon:yes stop_codon:yes gene_type:complete
MKKLAIFLIFSFFMVFLLQQEVFAEIEGKEEREKAAKEAANSMKRENIVKNEEYKIEEKEVIKEKEVRKSPSELIKLLPTENKLEEITHRTIWEYVDKQSTLDEEIGIETMTALLKDVSRVYDPIVNKYKVSTIQIEIIKYDDKYELAYYWDEISNSSIEKIFNNAYLIGSPSENIDCMFNYSKDGAMAICKTGEYVIQSIIFDKYQEHFSYNKLKIGTEKLELNQNEMATRIVEEILKNIEKHENVKNNYQLHKILKSNIEIKENTSKKITERSNSIDEEKKKSKSLGIEKNKKYGIQNVSCIKDEFGLITISGQFNNNQIKKEKIVLEILFLNYEQNVTFKNNANLLDIKEFETKRFLGNTKISKSFETCTIQMVN